MSAGALCVRSVHVASPGESVLEAAQRMREAGVGTLVVLDDKRRPVGILTDRDVAVRVVAERRDPAATRVSEAMTSPVQAVQESTPIEDAVARMEGAAIRRVAVTDADGRLWIAHWGGACVTCHAPDGGRELARIALPASNVTNVAFGGADMRTLFISTAAVNLSAAELARQPLAGGLFAVETNAVGLPPHRFGQASA